MIHAGHAPTVRQRLTGLLAAAAVLAIVAGLPGLLLAIGANPLPDKTPTFTNIKAALSAPDDGTLLLGLLEVVAWLAWAVMAVSLLVEAIALARRAPAPRLSGLGHPQAAARGLLALATLLFAATATQATVPASATPASATPSAAASATTMPSTSSSALTPATTSHAEKNNAAKDDTTDSATDSATHGAVPAVEQHPETVKHTVRPGESLWGLAEQHLGDGTRFHEIVDLNRDLLGSRPNFLQPGWVLQLPAGEHSTQTAAARPYQVRPGDTLSQIAQQQLGDANLYMEIFQASRQITQPGGVRLTDPDVIDVGWTLSIPGRAGATATDSPRTDSPRTGGEGTTSSTPDDAEPHQGSGSGAVPHDAPAQGPVLTHEPDASAGADAGGHLGRAVEPPSSAEQASPGTSAVVDADQVDDDHSIQKAPWILPGLTGGGVLLSGALLLALRNRRTRLFRDRPPGRNVAAPAPDLAPVEMTLNVTGTKAAATVEFADAALRRLAAAAGATGVSMPPLAAVELGNGALTLHLSAPAALPAPWDGTPDQTRWHISTDTDTADLGPDPDDLEPPYPLLVTVGTDDDGGTWLLNCEELATLTLSGDPAHARDFARHLAAQLAVNPWSRRVQLDCVGVAHEAAAMDERITFHSDGAAASAATAEILASAVTSVERATRHDTDVSTARTGNVDDDTWPARMLLLDAAAGDPDDLNHLLQLVNDHVGRAATSIVVAGERPGTPGPVLHMTNTGRVILEHVGLNLNAVSLTSDEANGCALLYAQADASEYQPAPVDESVTDGPAAYADTSGALRAEYTLPRDTAPTGDEEPVTSLLEGDDEDYLRQSAVTQEDLEELAPNVPAQVRREVEDKDPTLDQDLTDWFDPDSDRPRLTLLGRVTARTRGKALAKRKPYFTELLAFLALHRNNGATLRQISEAFGITDGKVRDYTNIVRDWLGTNPSTGENHLPYADKAPAARLTGTNVYQVDDGLLVDLDLFVRLRTRGQARGGTEGLADLSTALDLVTARPFSDLRENGWSWIANLRDRVDLMVPGWIADVALIVVTEALTAGDLEKARSAANIAHMADPDGESGRLCLAHVTKAEGGQFEADRIVREDICNRTDDDEAPMELSERTKTIIRTHGWLAS